MKIVILGLALCGSLLWSHSANAAYQGQVVNVAASNGKVAVIVANGNFDVPNSCAPNTAVIIYWIDPGTAFGRAQVALALTAKLTGRLTWTAGDGACVSIAPFGLGEGLLSMDLKG